MLCVKCKRIQLIWSKEIPSPLYSQTENKDLVSFWGIMKINHLNAYLMSPIKTSVTYTTARECNKKFKNLPEHSEPQNPGQHLFSSISFLHMWWHPGRESVFSPNLTVYLKKSNATFMITTQTYHMPVGGVLSNLIAVHWTLNEGRALIPSAIRAHDSLHLGYVFSEDAHWFEPQRLVTRNLPGNGCETGPWAVWGHQDRNLGCWRVRQHRNKVRISRVTQHWTSHSNNLERKQSPCRTCPFLSCTKDYRLGCWKFGFNSCVISLHNLGQIY